MQPCTGTTTQPSTKVNGDTTEAVVVAHGEVIAQERLHLFFSWFSVASLAHGVPMTTKLNLSHALYCSLR